VGEKGIDKMRINLRPLIRHMHVREYCQSRLAAMDWLHLLIDMITQQIKNGRRRSNKKRKDSKNRERKGKGRGKEGESKGKERKKGKMRGK
jgi:hypothetical protein